MSLRETKVNCLCVVRGLIPVKITTNTNSKAYRMISHRFSRVQFSRLSGSMFMNLEESDSLAVDTASPSSALTAM